MAAKEKEDLDLDTEKSGNGKKKLFIIIGVVLLLGLAGGAAMFFLSGDEQSDNKDSKTETEVAAHAPVIYEKLHRTFIINFEDSSKARYFQIDISVMSHVQHSIDLFVEHTPVIRNNIITILSSQSFEVLNTRAGKQKLNDELLKSINDTIIAEVSASPPVKTDEKKGEKKDGNSHTYIEAVYFTSFVMQ